VRKSWLYLAGLFFLSDWCTAGGGFLALLSFFLLVVAVPLLAWVIAIDLPVWYWWIPR